MNKYVRLTNSERLQKDIEKLKKLLCTADEDVAIQSALQLYLYEHLENYNIVTGDIDEDVDQN